MTEFTPASAASLVGSDTRIVLEIGANDGDDTIRFLEAMPSAKVYAFECDPRAIVKWRRKVYCDRASLFPIALCDRNGTCEFFPSGGTPPGPQWEGTGDWDKSGSILRPDRHQESSPWLQFGSKLSVACARLDDWAEEHIPNVNVIDFVWMDVQGAEAKVIEGGGLTIARAKFVYAECDPRPHYHGQATLEELDRLLAECGLERVGEHGGHNFLWGNSHL